MDEEAERKAAIDSFMPEIQNTNFELQWAIAAYHQAETYYNLIKSFADLPRLRLTRVDDELYSGFRQRFPDLQIDHLSVDQMNNDTTRPIWRTFLMGFKDKVEDYNMGTLLRLDSHGEYNEQNTCVVPRVQFYCIELARNREGLNKF
eukprot:TRINITY_DN7476_c0_g1_i1.p1 TRINITY_DN7476_c0_g1~~TRINITY_DN7476_c0_g1_i1.p1  ORF type:complete len:147 (-),score=19.68 TRINITY_DN7476_c0_g1_i1:133-573(-)